MNGVEVWRASLDRAPNEVDTLYSLLDASERIRSGRFKKELDRRRFIVSRGTLRMLLGRYTGTRPEDVSISVGTGGKPSLEAGSETGLRFNLSHCGDMALFAFSMREVGIDVQRAEETADIARVATHFFSPEESAVFASLSGVERVSFFYRTWVRKEAYVKARGEGFALDPARVLVDASQCEHASLRDESGVNRVDTAFVIHDLCDIGDYFSALAFSANAGPPAVSLREWAPGFSGSPSSIPA